MTQEEFEISNEKIIDLCNEIMASKGKAYTIGSTDRLANFKRTAERCGVTPLQVWAVFFEKQVSALMYYAGNPNAPQSEPIRMRVVDVMAYLQLGWGLIQEEERKKFSGMAGIGKLSGNPVPPRAGRPIVVDERSDIPYEAWDKKVTLKNDEQ